MTIWVGTSGWQYRSWKGPFYPTDLSQRGWLEHYTTRFPVVEVNNTFYMLPKAETFDRWRDGVPAGFLFVVKANRFITHIRRMRDARDAVNRFWERATGLGDRLGPVLFQFPPTLRADQPLLRDFLAVLPPRIRPAFEFRDPSWSRADVHATLHDAGAAWVLADRPGAKVPLVVTGGWSYVRFHQGRRAHPAYTRSKLQVWADRILSLEASDVWVFFNNDPLAAAPADAVTLAGLLRHRGAKVAGAPRAGGAEDGADASGARGAGERAREADGGTGHG